VREQEERERGEALRGDRAALTFIAVHRFPPEDVPARQHLVKHLS
jgi:hypothetical protein